MNRSEQERSARRLRVLAVLAVALAAPAVGGVSRVEGPSAGTDALWSMPGPVHPPRVAAAVTWMRGDRLDPARATPGALTLVPGIGPVRARELATALSAGRVREPADLLALRGFGPVLSARVAEHLNLDS